MDNPTEAKTPKTPEEKQDRKRQIFIKQRLKELKDERAALVAERKEYMTAHGKVGKKKAAAEAQ